MKWKLVQQLILFFATLLAFTGSFATQSVMPGHQVPNIWQRIYKENDSVMLIVLGEKRIWGSDPVAIIIDRWKHALFNKKMPAKACAFFSGKCISGAFIQRSDCSTEGSACSRLGGWNFYYRNGKPMQVRLEAGWPRFNSIHDDMPTSAEPVSNEDAFEKAGREISNYEKVKIDDEFSVLVHDDYKMTWDAMHYAGGRPDLPLPSMFDGSCEPLSATVSLWNEGVLVWSKTFGRNFNKDIEPLGNKYRNCGRAYMTSGVGQFLILGDSLFVTTDYENGFVLRFRIRDGYSRTPHDTLIVMDSEKVVAAKRALRAEYLELMEKDNIPGWEEIPTRKDTHERNVEIDYFKKNDIDTEILRRRDKSGDPLSTERISKALLNKLSIH